MTTEQRRALANTTPTTDAIRDAVTFPRDRLGEPLDISPERFEAWLARVRRDAQREAYTTARSVLAGEDTVEWARGAHGSSMSYPHAIGIMDDLIEDLDGEVSP